MGVTAVLLAAGESTRMGQLKALLPWQGRPLLRYQAEALLAAPVERLVVVLGHRREELEPVLPTDKRLQSLDNPDYRSGKVSSIVAGVRAAPAEDDVLLVGVDQPRPVALLERVIEAHASANALLTVAAYQGRSGHPVVFSAALRPELLAISESTEGLRAVLRRHAREAQLVETGDPLALVNLNTRQDYEAALLLSTTSSARAGNQ
jgi:molybdenum cofactor cytidylyltransferase